MPTPLVKLVALILLMTQGLVAFAPGKVLCIPLFDCDTHEARALSVVCDHGEIASCHAVAVARASCQDHEPGPFTLARHHHDECGCHVHLPVPGGSGALPTLKRGDSPDLQLIAIPLLMAVVLDWDLVPPPAPCVALWPPDFSVSDQVLSLKATRLLI